MREFFKGWRRKAGCVTLGLALALFGGWLRGIAVHDRGSCPLGSRSIIWIESGDGLLELGIKRTTRDITEICPLNENPNLVSYAPEEHSPRIQIELAERLFGVGDFGIFAQAGNYHLAIAGVEFVAFPYLSLVLTLTLLSAYLLLAKPRARAPKTTEPTPTAGP